MFENLRNIFSAKYIFLQLFIRNNDEFKQPNSGHLQDSMKKLDTYRCPLQKGFLKKFVAVVKGVTELMSLFVMLKRHE